MTPIRELPIPTRGLTVIQPWGYSIERLGKDVDNRTWSPASHLIGQRIAIHAGVKPIDTTAIEFIERVVGYSPEVRANLMTCHRGAIIATATLLGWIERDRRGDVRGEWLLPEADTVVGAIESRWFMGPVGHVLGDVRPLNPILCKGAQGYWTLPIEARLEIARQQGVTLST